MTSVYDFTAETLAGEQKPIAAYRGRVLLIVNTASKCGFTPQYAELEAMQRDYAESGFSVLGFPCNQFGAQEPGDAAEIASFCALTYDVHFPLFAKIEVNGENTHPLYRHLKAAARGVLGTQRIKWNFTKFLVDRKGRVVTRYAPTMKPATIRPTIETMLWL